MSLFQNLYETYNTVKKDPVLSDSLYPMSHIPDSAHIEIIIDAHGNFKDAKAVSPDDREIVVPVTEKTRTSGCVPYPLCDTIQYVAGDFTEYFPSEKSYFEYEKGNGYLPLLKDWCSKEPHPKNIAVLAYVSKKSVIGDLVAKKILTCDAEKKLKWNGSKDNKLPEIKKLIIRWRVEIPMTYEDAVWKDETLFESWSNYDSAVERRKGLCIVIGEEMPILEQHSAEIRWRKDTAKIISANDSENFVFLGRFSESWQAAEISHEASLKAHSALRWLIRRKKQIYRPNTSDLTVVFWRRSGKELPIACCDTESFFSESERAEIIRSNDIGEIFANRFRMKLSGYKIDNVGSDKNIFVLGLDSASKGRLSMVYYRELAGSEFLERIEKWHSDFAWLQDYGGDLKFYGAPSPENIALAAYGTEAETKKEGVHIKIDEKLKSSTVKRLLPCIIDGRPLPLDLVDSAFKKIVNVLAWRRNEKGQKRQNWEKNLGIACALFKGSHKGGGYQMALETERDSRDYLFGRLLAVAERIERVELSILGENRDTNAERYMQRFSIHPCSTWRQIEVNLVPYEQRLRVSRTGFLINMKNLIDSICNMFKTDEFTNDNPLSGEFLLGYHCQRFAFKKDKEEENKDESQQEN